ncbi:MAG: GDP-mannose 4,6-dehydratase [Promethearchaeota archaeon]
MLVLITGGAGFIGSHLVDELLNLNHEIIVFDSLEPQVHGSTNKKSPIYLSKEAKFIHNDIRNKEALIDTLTGVEVIFHLASMVGVGQSMYQIDKYVDVNVSGTAKLLDILVNKENDVKKLIVASSMSTYGEGAYICENCHDISPSIRNLEQLKRRDWELRCPKCGRNAKPIPTTENKIQDCTSIYALTKKEQEKMCLLIGETYGIDTTALRLFNVYGSRQALSNPYTGVCAIFSTSLLANNPPIIYEDGKQTRDLVHVKDICQAFILAMKSKQSKNEVFNVGTGRAITIKEIAEILANHINPNIKPNITNNFRPGDIRHCFSDISKISSKLGYKPQISFEEGVKELIEWVKLHKGAVKDKTFEANQKLKEMGLIK